MGITEDVFQTKEKECKDQERLKTCRRKSISERSEREEAWGSREKFCREEGGSERRIRLVRVRTSAELEQVVSSFATQGF